MTDLPEDAPTDPRLAAFDTRLRAVVDADRESFAPPSDLAVRTVSRLAQVLVAEGRFDSAGSQFRDPPVAVPSEVARRPISDGPVFFAWARADVLVMAALLFLAVALGGPLVQKLRRQADVAACQNQLRSLAAALHGYADAHGGRLPQVGTADLPVAGGFVAELVRSGHAEPGRAVGCGKPEGDPDPGYAYTLGHVNAGGWLTGVRLTEVSDTTPVAADLPRFTDTDTTVRGRHGGWNVLAAGGGVRFVTTAHAGLDGDDIFRNDDGFHRAGRRPTDTSLGRPFDRP